MYHKPKYVTKEVSWIECEHRQGEMTRQKLLACMLEDTAKLDASFRNVHVPRARSRQMSNRTTP